MRLDLRRIVRPLHKLFGVLADIIADCPQRRSRRGLEFGIKGKYGQEQLGIVFEIAE
ncbi:hypothetical protein ACFQWB_15445 [Paenibacillus thermoaerophilus]|uniref:Transposase DDE domain-containing protein n=1 Tax=Paenibacillus thermoaerophilus TaxID=1215385 RepID=A0ABW2V6X0_9BACL|nr:hypothetical protein [Paenibacillus thermoaerophilus]